MTDLDADYPGRRDFLSLSIALAGGLLIGEKAIAKEMDAGMPMPRTKAPGAGRKVAMLIHPRMALLDLVGPQTILRILGCDIYLVAKTLDPVSTDVGISVTPDITFDHCPNDLDVLFVPGGLMGSLVAMEDQQTLSFLADRGASAKYVTGVCTGGLVLAAAGLLKGYRATAHWGVVDLLPLMGAVHERGRVVHDRNRLTGGGVTAGLDFGLTLASQLCGEDAAKHVQLIIEYSPEPPFHSGTPEEVGAERMIEERKGRVWMDGQARQASERAAARLGLQISTVDQGIGHPLT
ncbi:DJ-1/PfpI family protein [Pseudomonas helleri]|uniref:DJ-1/PfpI family protein n=4 Tax=Pseudomonas TaxID=286 RepID=A0A6A7ZHD8_9PSED|nr:MULTISPECIES: DJ-1/PfpI family protein [Pseudomonas]MQT33076.1 DJ-1/PfpI family protein [Pseudomonas helleri]MQT39051.1 DJ-1/PfpI family protein [Pseudomonas helleri]MQT77970.1 DJ-1/PfpI family protein [Pseudomonas helleri]MQT98457.1 DJ-1/PfpI family protein [Pseudomonas helleri]MQU24438.1 DJ-1/PfpI family protein [Pseudomonas helleri]